ncbi:hypothetical protein EXIGLDRAFT_843431 [Exidia glandulosa HHB12029]|uniref:Ubinuclein middle domain-containing protein n=1 Tax=Exidia glandulosa HHB12029 TaxID=1314781 RepID=A0A165CNC7_EXIGL|nr:hypothetical protein EXIGLDRAFT_843431 [Exidia glandulosa HHB12029]
MSSKASPIILDDTEPEDNDVEANIHVIPPTSPLEPLTDTANEHTPTASREGSPSASQVSAVDAMEVDEGAAGGDTTMDVDEPDEPDAADGDGPDDGEQADAESHSESESDTDDDEGGEGDEPRAEEDITQSPRHSPKREVEESEPAPDASSSKPPSPSPKPDLPPAVTNGETKAESAPRETTPAGKTGKKPSSAAAKPKSKRQHRSPTPPPKPPPPMQTVRMTIKLDTGKSSNREYAFDLAKMAEEQGMQLRPPQPILRLESDSEDDDAGGGNNSAEEAAKAIEERFKDLEKQEKPKKRRKRKRTDEQYDLEDEFIDDSELAIEERKFFAQTKQTGFYVSSGEVALLREKTEPSKRSPKKPAVAPGAKDSDASSTKDAPIAAAPATKKKPKEEPVPPPEYPPSIPLADKPKVRRSALARTLAALPGESVARESECMRALVKRIEMPPPLPSTKPRRHSINGDAENPVVIASDEDSDEHETGPTPEEIMAGGRGTKRKASMAGPNDTAGTPGDGDMVAEPRKRRKTLVELPKFSKELMPDIEMLRRLVEREDEAFSIRGKFPQHVKPVLQAVAMKAIVLDEYDDDFFDAMPKIFPYNRFTMKKLIARTVFKDHIDLINKRQDELLVDLKRIVDTGFERAKEDHARAVAAWEFRLAKKKNDTNAAADAAPPVAVAVDDANAGEREDKPPQQKYKLTEGMRIIIWNLVSLTNDIAILTGEKNKYENVNEVVSEQGMRKILYQKIQSCFPDNWMNTGILSREVSSLKKKQGRENMAELPDA